MLFCLCFPSALHRPTHIHPSHIILTLSPSRCRALHWHAYVRVLLLCSHAVPKVCCVCEWQERKRGFKVSVCFHFRYDQCHWMYGPLHLAITLNRQILRFKGTAFSLSCSVSSVLASTNIRIYSILKPVLAWLVLFHICCISSSASTNDYISSTLKYIMSFFSCMYVYISM